MASCHQCGAPMNDDDAFCGACGAKAPDAAEPAATTENDGESNKAAKSTPAPEPTVAPAAEQPAPAPESAPNPELETEGTDAGKTATMPAIEPAHAPAPADAAVGADVTVAMPPIEPAPAAGAPMSADVTVAMPAIAAEPSPAQPAAAPIPAPAPAAQPTQAFPPVADGGAGVYAGYGQASYAQPQGQAQAQGWQGQGQPYAAPQGGYQQPAGAAPYAQQYAAPAPAPKGPLGLAWADFSHANGKLPTMLKLAAAQFLPGVGSLMMSGYAYTFGKQRALGRVDAMPQKIVRPGVLDNGLYVFGTQLIANALFFVAWAIVTGIFGLVHLDVVGTILMLAAFVFVWPFIQTMSMRAAICGRVRSGLNVREAWRIMFESGKLGQVMAASWVPGLVVCGIGAVLGLIFMLVVGLIVGMSVGAMGYGYGLGSYGYYGYGVDPLAMLGVASGAGFALIIVFALLAFAIFFVTTSAIIVSARAYGYIFETFAPSSWPEYRENSERYAREAL